MLASSLAGTLSCLANFLLYGLPKDGATYSGLGPPAIINNQGNAPQTCPQANLIDTLFGGGLPLR